MRAETKGFSQPIQSIALIENQLTGPIAGSGTFLSLIMSNIRWIYPNALKTEMN